MTFYQNLGLIVFYQTEGTPLIRWIHNDSMYVRFGEINWKYNDLEQVYFFSYLVKTSVNNF